MDISTETLVLGGLAQSADFSREVTPFLEVDYFQSRAQKTVFGVLKNYSDTYKTLPDRMVVSLDIKNHPSLSDAERNEADALIQDAYNINIPKLDPKWLAKQAEEFCQKKAVYLAIMKSISIYDGSDKTLSTHAIPDLLQKAISISFETSIGMDFFEDAEKRYDYYSSPDSRVPFDINILNEVTNGGIKWKTLNIILAGINVGKTLCMIHMAAAYLKMGYNVIYFSMEMSEYEILNRVDANLLNIDMNSISDVPRDKYLTGINKLKTAANGQIRVVEFPPGVGTAAHFKHAMHELETKKNFKANIVIVDYLGITGSSRIKLGSTNSYFYLKAVAEELRALAVESETALWTAMQLTRSGISSSDVEITDVSECLDPNSLVVVKNEKIKIKDLRIGDQILTHSGRTTTIKMKGCPIIKKAVKIKTKSGKEIICSLDHIFPTLNGRQYVRDLKIGDLLNSV